MTNDPFPVAETADVAAYQRLRDAHQRFHALPRWRLRERAEARRQADTARAQCLQAGRSADTAAVGESTEPAVASAAPLAPIPPSRRRRVAGSGAGVVSLIAVFAALNASGHNPLPGNVPLIGHNATSVFRQMQNAGLPIGHGVPEDAKFRDVTEHNNCKSSRAFVRTDADQGWGLICVRPPSDVYQRISHAFDRTTSLLGPLYVDDRDGDTIIFGFGWPENASKQVYDAIGASGTYLQFEAASSY